MDQPLHARHNSLIWQENSEGENTSEGEAGEGVGRKTKLFTKLCFCTHKLYRIGNFLKITTASSLAGSAAPAQGRRGTDGVDSRKLHK